MRRAPRNRSASPLAGLSPRRRLLIACIAALVAAAAAVGAVLAVQSARPTAAGPPAEDQPGPVLLVPGYGGSTSALGILASRIRATGRIATVVRLPAGGTGSLIADAAALNDAVRRAMAGGAHSVDVIGYSAGGVVVLLWARHDDGVANARRIVTLGSPFHGTELAAGAAGLVPGACPIACQQLAPGSSLLASLDVANGTGLPRWLSVWTTDDQTVTPPASARLAGAVNVPIQSLCPGASITHSQLPVSPIVTAIVLEAISRRPLRTPSVAVCAGRTR